jgi:hypothetical protein
MLKASVCLCLLDGGGKTVEVVFNGPFPGVAMRKHLDITARRDSSSGV